MSRTHNGGLYCNEGSTHVSRPSIKIRQTPGGNSSWNFLASEAEPPVQTSITKQRYTQNENVQNQNQHHQQQQPSFAGKGAEEKQQPSKHNPQSQHHDIYGRNESQFPAQKQPQQQQPQKEESNSAWSGGAALYCTEGSQVRSKPSVRVRGEAKRDYNIISFN